MEPIWWAISRQAPGARRLIALGFALAVGVLAVSCASAPVSARSADAPQPLSPSATSGLFPKRTAQTNGASLALDAAGGMHLGYSAWGPDGSGKEPAYYARCTANCAVAANWATATVSDGSSSVSIVQLALDPSGRPRMLLYGHDANVNYQWQYAACDSGCTSAANWTVLTLVQPAYNDVTAYEYPLHNFALDALGRPRFIYYDTRSGNVGTWYAYCDSACANGDNWFQFQLSSDPIAQPALTFSGNLPRIAAVPYATSGPTTGMLSYFACDAADCSVPGSWSLATLYERGGGQATWSLRVDASGRPRLAFYQAVPDSGGGNRLYYAWCNSACGSAANWGSASLGLAQGSGEDPDLALTAQGRPRIAYRAGAAAGLGYSSCDSNCESGSGTWLHQVFEASGTLDADWPIPPPAPCSSANWVGGYRPSLALDAGQPRIGYVAEHLYGGGTCSVGQDYQAVRLAVSGAPAGGSAFYAYIPVVVR